jgi:hypothetical protein
MTSPANPAYDQILSTTLAKWLEKNFVDNVWKARVLFFMLNKSDNIRKIDGGESIIVPVLEGDNGTVMTYSQDEELKILRQKGMTAARYTWAQAAVSVTITGIEEAQNRGESRMIDLLETKTEQAEESFAAYFNRVWFGSGANAINQSLLDTNVRWNGLTDFLTTATATIGGITGHAGALPTQAGPPGTGTLADSTAQQVPAKSGNLGSIYPTDVGGGPGTVDPGYGNSPAGFWLPLNATVAAPASPSGAVDMVLGKRAMRSMYNSISIGQDQPQAIIGTQALYEAYEDSLVDQVRYTSTEMADAGFQNLMYKGCPITYDADQTALKMDFLNFRYLRIVGHSDTWFKNTPFVRPNNRDARTSQVLCYGQFVCMKRSAQGRLTFTAAP